MRPWGKCLLSGSSSRENGKSFLAWVHTSRCLLITRCGYSHHFCWSGWHLVCVISGVCQSCRLLSAHWLTKAIDSSRPKGFIQTDMLRIHPSAESGKRGHELCCPSTTHNCYLLYLSDYYCALRVSHSVSLCLEIVLLNLLCLAETQRLAGE